MLADAVASLPGSSEVVLLGLQAAHQPLASLEQLGLAVVALEPKTHADVQRVIRLVKFNEYKRRQAPVGIRVSHRSFGKDWRYPITSKFL